MELEKQEKEASDQGYVPEGQDEEVGVVNKGQPLSRDLQGRHMQMIAIGTAPLFFSMIGFLFFFFAGPC